MFCWKLDILTAALRRREDVGEAAHPWWSHWED